MIAGVGHVGGGPDQGQVGGVEQGRAGGVYRRKAGMEELLLGVDQVDKAVIEAGRGMGLTRFQALRSIELPLAVPVMLAGVRTALIIHVGMAALAFLIGGGGLGVTISAGLKLQQNLVIITGAALTAILALTIDWIAAMAEQFLRPKGLK